MLNMKSKYDMKKLYLWCLRYAVTMYAYFTTRECEMKKSNDYVKNKSGEYVEVPIWRYEITFDFNGVYNISVYTHKYKMFCYTQWFWYFWNTVYYTSLNHKDVANIQNIEIK